MYKYAFIDANYILKRNGSAMFRGGAYTVSQEGLTRSFYSSINKINKELGKIIGEENGYEIPILLFDRYPYRKSSAFPAYKGDRIYYTIDYIKEHLDELLESGELVNAKKEADYNEVMMKTKYNILWHPDKGMKTLGIKGFEADDLAYLLSKVVEDKDYKSILISVDHDWNTFSNDNVDFMTPPGKYPMNDRKDERNKSSLMAEAMDVTLYELGLLNELYNKSHNNIEVYKDVHPTIKYKDFCESMTKSLDKIPDYSTYKTYYDAMNMNQYLDEFKSLDDVIKLEIE